MKKLTLWALLLTLALCLTACGQNGGTPNVSNPNLGKYRCTSVQMKELDLGSSGEWLELKPDGKMTVFLTEEPDSAEWTLNGTQFSMTVAGKAIGTGTLTDGILNVELMGMSYTFVKEGVPAPAGSEQSTENQDSTQAEGSSAPAKGTAIFACYDTLYYVNYPTSLFHQDPDGLADLCADDGTKAWITKLNSKEDIADLTTGFDQKANSEDIQNYETMDLTVAGYPARCILYTKGDLWTSELIVNLGKDRGTRDVPMYAAYFHFSGASREAVWGEPIQDMVNSLRLGK